MPEATMAASALALAALAAVHLLRRDVDPARSMISVYALGAHGWVMALCFAALGMASGLLFVTLVPSTAGVLNWMGLACLAVAAVGLVMAGRFPMDPAGTPRAQASFAGKMHGLAFAIGVPGMLVAVLLLSVVLRRDPVYAAVPLVGFASLTWVSVIAMFAVMAMVGPAHPPDPGGPLRFIGLPNRMLMIGYALWLIAAAWPLA